MVSTSMAGKRHSRRIAVLGAGIMGCCLALELAEQGHDIDLLEAAVIPMAGASLNNEGKIHLGFVYAKDPLQETYKAMQRGAFSFSSILGRLTGCDPKAYVLSQPFQYYVPNDSVMDMDQIQGHFQRVEDNALRIQNEEGGRYLGRRFERFYERNQDDVHAALFSQEQTLGSFRTWEMAADPFLVADILRRRVLAHSGIHFKGSTLVLAASRVSDGRVDVEGIRDGAPFITRHPCVVNCLWDGKLAVDRTAGIEDDGPWIMRYKGIARVSAPYAMNGGIPTATGVVGSYGDVVNYGDGRFYVCWYPRCRRAQCVDEDGRKLHDRFHRFIPRQARKLASAYPPVAQFLGAVAHRKFAKENIRSMAACIPSMRELLNRGLRCVMGGGVIVAKGETDIDDPASGLHQRHALGPTAHGSYVTVYPGKFTTAPHVAAMTAETVADIMR